jgi:hypothetical protein
LLPPFVTDAVKSGVAPLQIGPGSLTVAETVARGVTVVIVFDAVAVRGGGRHTMLEVIVTATTSLTTSWVVLYDALLPDCFVTPLTCQTYEGLPPFVGLAVKVAVDPAQMLVGPAKLTPAD